VVARGDRVETMVTVVKQATQVTGRDDEEIVV